MFTVTVVVFLSLSLHFFLFYFFPADYDLDFDSFNKELVKLPFYIVKDGKLQRVEGSTPFPCLHFFFFSLFYSYEVWLVTNGERAGLKLRSLYRFNGQKCQYLGSLGAKFGMF